MAKEMRFKVVRPFSEVAAFERATDLHLFLTVYCKDPLETEAVRVTVDGKFGGMAHQVLMLTATEFAAKHDCFSEFA